jgi:tRNA (cmo5U34)-methyltransferase
MSQAAVKDQVFAKPVSRAADFKFDETVARAFDDMVERSVPMYEETQRMTVELAANFVQPDSRIYDLGSATGTTLALLAHHITDPSVRLIGIDNAKAMIDKSREKLARVNALHRSELVLADLDGDFEMRDASVAVMIYTLQFVRPLHRDALVRRIAAGMKEGGCLIVAEKIVQACSLINRLYIDLYFSMKRRRGYSDTEIVQKREALENVLIPYTQEENKQLFLRNGFSHVEIFFNWYNFAGFLAIKT